MVLSSAINSGHDRPVVFRSADSVRRRMLGVMDFRSGDAVVHGVATESNCTPYL